MKTETKLTFDELVKLEPELGRLLADAKAHRPEKGCYYRDWYKLFKPRLIRLVGLMAEKDNVMLCSSEAYSLAYHTILDAMGMKPNEIKEPIK